MGRVESLHTDLFLYKCYRIPFKECVQCVRPHIKPQANLFPVYTIQHVWSDRFADLAETPHSGFSPYKLWISDPANIEMEGRHSTGPLRPSRS
ncbi:hypothetical protein GDO78_000425 [Eleutherodactylus coqui]|uniref:Uncharacterized protein n=1 Tax=Eleutherodactylus coqui TaxID=57060 RepID=A0A8J6FP85_ELECQ|nr:hypothetical protein GDO78_000425 [Eleutherodactylus coqui]